MTKTYNFCPDDQLAAARQQVAEDDPACRAEVDRLSAAYPEDARLHFLSGSLAAGESDYAGARQAMARAVALAPRFSLARFQLGLLLLTSGEASEATAMLEPLMALDPHDPFHHFAAGLVHLMRDEFAVSIDALERGIDRNHDNIPLNRDMGMLIAEIRANAKADGDGHGEPQSAAHLLLQQSALKATRH